ncbi:hypothetical protein STEG23_036916, partial [Scotinomys teguina]
MQKKVTAKLCYDKFVYMVNYTVGFLYIEPSLHLRNEDLIVLDDLFDVFLDSVSDMVFHLSEHFFKNSEKLTEA